MIRIALALLGMIAASTAALANDARPGGIAMIDIGAATEEHPRVRYSGKPVLTMQDDGRWIAAVGISLDTQPGSIEVDVGGERRTVAVHEHTYVEQRLNVDRKYVELSQASLDRIGRERKIIDAALNRFVDAPIESIRMIAPVDGRRSSSFGLRRFFNEEPRAPHKGMDIAAVVGTPIKTPLAGEVVATGDYYFNGQTVIVDHGQGLISLYCHLSVIGVEEGEQLQAGDILGEVGKTGRVTGAHLHFGTYLNGTAVDPAILLTSSEQ
ncbi:MAG: peptidoglycan DD-metalloendopeptidase family protein [Woeseiaceae bacterium]|nr:peptidoglycan DD-metalloendopeptidase family protein [Woeseiaceae bacterium]